MRSPAASSRRPGTVPRQRNRGAAHPYDDEPEGAKPVKGKKKGKKKASGKAADAASDGKKRGKRPLWATLLVVVGALMVVVSGGGIISAKILIAQATDGISEVQIPVDPENKAAIVAGKSLEGALNILLVGVDDGQADGGEQRTSAARADSIMILHVTEQHDQGYIVSLPRDLWVSIPPYKTTGYGGGKEKLNAAYYHGYGPAKGGGPGRAGGLALLMNTINKETGITFNAAAIVNFTGFTAALKELGGVTMYIDEKVTSVHYGTHKNGGPCTPATFDGNAVAHPVRNCQGRIYEKGTRRLNPEEALDYTRQREWMELGDGDYGRQRHQQQFIKALAREAKNQGYMTNPAKALNLVKSVGSALTVWNNGVKLEDWFFTLKDLAGNDIMMVKTNKGAYFSAGVTGISAEGLSPESRQMLAALRDHKLPQWLLTHSDWIGQDSA